MVILATAALVVVQGVAALRLRAPLPALAPRTALRAGAVSLSDPPPEPVLVSSPTPGAEPVPVGEGDAVLCKDQASQAWWRATVRQTRGDQLLVHYMGCDDAWDEWFDASSPDICAVDAQEAARGAFQSEEAELELEGMGDEEILEAYRAQKWANNARWQLATFAQAQLGEWKGSCVAYEPSGPPGEVPKWVAGPSLPSAGAVAVERDGEVAWRDAPPDKAYDTSRTLTPASFDRQRGCACVGNGYSFTAGSGEQGEDAGADGALLFELGVREEGRRVRVKFVYAAAAEGDLSLERVLVAREAESGGGGGGGGGGGAEEDLPPGSGERPAGGHDGVNSVSSHL